MVQLYVLVCVLLLTELLTFMFLSLSTEHVVFLCVTCPCSFWTKCHPNLLVNNNNNNNNNMIHNTPDTRPRNLYKFLRQILMQVCASSRADIPGIQLRSTRCKKKLAQRNHDRRAGFLSKSTCRSFLYEFLECVSEV